MLISGGATTIENLNGISHIIFDKTGTLTHGSLTVDSVHLEGMWTKSESLVWMSICAIEESAASNHPVARALFKKGIQHLEASWAERRRTDWVRNFKETLGKGICGDVEIQPNLWLTLHVGSMSFLRESCVQVAPTFTQSEKTGMSVYVSINGEHVATILLQVNLFAHS